MYRPLLVSLSLLLAWAQPASTAPASSATDDRFVAPFVSTPMRDVEQMLDMAGVSPGDYLIDLGSGDGRIVIAAAMRGAIGHGVELDPQLVERSLERARQAGVGDQVTFVHGDVFEADIRAASVVTLYLFPEANIALRPRLLEQLQPGTRLISNNFDMDDWLSDRHEASASSGGIHLWHVPADASGYWQVEWQEPGMSPTLRRWHISQRFQHALVSVADAPSAAVARLRGERIGFTLEFGDERLAMSGEVDGETMRGIAQHHRQGETTLLHWRAVRDPGSRD